MPEPRRPLKVFPSYTHSDAVSVHGLYNRLTKDGVDVWLDKAKLLPGQDLERLIQWDVRMVGSLFVIIPVVIVFFLMQRHYVAGLTGSIKS